MFFGSQHQQTEQENKFERKHREHQDCVSVLSHSFSGLSKHHPALLLPTQNDVARIISLAHYLDLSLCNIPLALHQARCTCLWLPNLTPPYL